MPPRKPPPIPAWRNALSIAKDALPWLLLIAHLIFGSGVKQSLFEQQKQQAEAARADMQKMQKQITDLVSQQAALAAEVDLLIRNK